MGKSYGTVLVSQGLGAVCWIVAVFAPTTALTITLFGLAWIPVGVSGVLTATLNQRVFPTDLLGRVSATKGTASGATLPLGSLVGGGVAEALGTTTTMELAASGFGFTAVYVLLRPRIRRLPAVETATPDDFDLETETH
ncbi:hypothetical protein Hhis01_03938 [Haloarcula hispanica]|nr:hypothetical protein [Haloarcula hispanica]